MGKEPLVSIIMPFFNEEIHINNSIESILNQTYKNIELILINDYSYDKSLEIANNYRMKDQRIKIISKSNQHRGAGIARNIGINLANGDYIAFQDADDTCNPRRIEKQLTKVLERPEKVIVGCNVRIINERENYIKILPEVHQEIIKGFKKVFGRGNYFVMGTALGPKEIFQLYPSKEVLRYVEDWDQLLRIYESGRVEFYNMQEPLYNYNQTGGISDFKEGWIEANLFVRFSQRMRARVNIDPQTKEELQVYLDKNPLEKLYHSIFKKGYYARSKLR